MALISRPYQYVSGNTIDPAEVMAVEDTIIDEINGNLDETNLSASTQIPSDYLAVVDADRVDDSSGSATGLRTTRTPGTSGAPNLPTTQKHEIQTLRFRQLVSGRHRISTAGTAGGGGSFINDSNTADTIAWYESPVVNTGRNLLPNNGFEVKTTGNTSAPDGWSLVGTPSGLTIITTAQDTLGSSKRALRIQNDAADEGISCTVKGLKASTKYLIGVYYVRTAGTVKFATTGALGAGNDYQNYSATDSSSSSLALTQFVVQTDTSGTDIVFNITISSGSGGDVAVYSTWMYELNDFNQGELPLMPTITNRVVTAATYPTTWTGSAATWRTDTISSLTATQYIPFWGYRLRYTVSIPYKDVDVSAGREGSRVYLAIQANIDGGGATTVAGPIFQETTAASSDVDTGGTLFLEYVLDNPVPGSTYVMTALLGVYDGSDSEQISSPPYVDSAVQMASESRLILERM